MANSLSKRIAQNAQQRNFCRSAQHRATFLALQTEIEQARQDGWSVKSIWKTLHHEGKVIMGYQTFLKHVHQLILGSKTQTKTVSVHQHDSKPDQTSKPQAGFRYNPHPNKADLL